MSLKVGITGGIGSGKTTVCRIFEVLGVPVYYADERAKALMAEDADLVRAIKELLGPQAYNADGALDRRYIAGQVFGDAALLASLNALVHPAVGRDAERWQEARANKAPYTLQEAALLYESGGWRRVDKMIVVTAPEEVRLARVMARDQVTEADVRARMLRQLPEAEKVARADFVIHNDGEHSLVRQVLDLHRQLLAEAAEQSTHDQ